jgi:glycosyltransferase involved in cell wall biosynthesis
MNSVRRGHVRVLYFSSFADRGRGGQESLFYLVSSLDQRRFSPLVVVPAEGSLSKSLSESGIEVHVLDLAKVGVGSLQRAAESLYRLSSLINKEAVDILHTDGPRNTFYAGLCGRLHRKPVIWHVRANAADPFDRCLCSMSSKLILVADVLRSRFSFCTEPGKLVTIYNGVDTGRFKPTAIPPEAMRPPVKKEACIIATVGRIEEQKGLLHLLQACGGLKRSGRSFEVRIAGEVTDRSYYDRCFEFCRSEGLLDRVRYLGHLPHVEQLLATADVFVLPSSGAEAFPRVVIEAMASGVPVVVTDAGGSPEAVENGINGFVVPAKVPSVLGEKLTALLQDAALRFEMGQCGRLRAAALFSIEKNHERTVRLYEEVLLCR